MSSDRRVEGSRATAERRDPAGSPRPAIRMALGAFIFLTIYFTGTFPPRANPNDLSRFEAVVAMGEWRTFSIDRAIALLGDHEDKAASGGHFYSNKAPGLAIAAYPAYRALRLVLPRSRFGTFDLVFAAVRFLTVSLSSILALSLLARRIETDAKPRSVAGLVVLAAGFGTPFLFYARSFFSHAWAASLLFFAWECLRRDEKPPARRIRWIAVLAGFFAGLAVISEYTVAPIALVLALRAGMEGRRRRAVAFAVGALPCLAILAAYNAACFGSPFVLSYVREATREVAAVSSSGFAGFRSPSPAIALAYFFHPARGVLLFSPFLAWSAIGVVRWWRSGRNRADCVFVLAATPLFFALLCMYPLWHGGGSLGSRYLLPGLFLVVVPIAYGLDSALSRGLFVAATAFSIAQHFLLTATYPHLGLEFPWPAATASLWFLERGFVAPNLGTLAGAGPLGSLLPPMAATLAATLLATRFARPMSPRVSWALSIGLAPLAVLLMRPPPVSFETRLLRAGVIHDFSGLDPEAKELQTVKREATREATTPEDRRRAERAVRAPTAPPTMP